MRIVIDMQGAQSPASKDRGVGRYTKEMVYAFLQYCNEKKLELDVFLVCNSTYLDQYESIRSHFSDVIAPDRILAWQQCINEVSGMNGRVANRSAAEILREWYIGQLSPDIVWSTNLQEGWQDNCVTSVKRLLREPLFVSTLHDLIPMIYKDEYLKTDISDWYFEKIDFARKSDLILTVSCFSRDKIIELLHVDSEDVLVAPNGVSSYFDRERRLDDVVSAEILSLLLERPFLFYIGGFDKHKNIEFLIKSFSQVVIDGSPNLVLLLGGSISLARKRDLLQLAEFFGCDSNRIIFSGYVSDQDLAYLYREALLFVFPSYSEGFGIPILEAMAMGCPVVAANAASLPEIINDESMLFDPCDEGDLVRILVKMVSDESLRNEASKNNYTRALRFSWKESAENIYSKFLEIYNNKYKFKKELISIGELYSKLAEIDGFDVFGASQSISNGLILDETPTLYLDISCLVHFDHATGIQRVVRAIMEYCILNPPDKWRVELIFSYSGHRNFYHVHMSGDQLTVFSENELHNNVVDFSPGDVVVFLDLHPGSAISKSDEIVKLRSRGVKTVFIVYDLLPLEFPNFFVTELSEEFKLWLSVVASSDMALCISRDVMHKLSGWISKEVASRNPLLSLEYFHLGADLQATRPSKGLPDSARAVLDKIRCRKSFLMVGTVEPRKSYGFVLDAFECLWEQGADVVLVIVGKPGWKNDITINRLRTHVEVGNNLIWLEGISDEYLDMLYDSADALISASLGEGFGLPLIEAAQKKMPIIARDIAVFREVAGDDAFYFDSKDARDLSMAISKWLELYYQNEHPRSENMPWITWEQSAKQLLDKIIKTHLNTLEK
jgi:glycosyltransferase involved in cell wall biosynthesis